jgi:hypothetical protein
MVIVTYSTASTVHLPGGQPAQQLEMKFASPEEIRLAGVPSGYVFAYFKTEDAKHIFSSRWGWEAFSQ